MKKQMTIIGILMVVFMIVANTNVHAQNYAEKKFVNSEQAVQNLISGISSENEGLRRSSIYFAGYYKLDTTIDALTQQLKVEENPSTRILIALSLFQIGDENAMQYVKELSLRDSDAKVQRLAKAIFQVYIEEGTQTYAITQPGL